jgi:uracil-DNA glycosylase
MTNISKPFDKTLDSIHNCTLCTDELAHGVRPVLQIHPKAKILIAGQAPGRVVHETGIPFDDQSGDRLRQWLGLTKDQFYNPELVAILPMSFCFPGSGKSGDLPPCKKCAPTWREDILELLPNIELNLVIGIYAQKWHLGKDMKKNLTETVRAWLEYPKSVLPLPHPSPRNFIWMNKNTWFEDELIPELQKRVARISS